MLASEISFQSLFSSDVHFDSILPRNIKEKSAKHWTPLEVAKTAAKFLAPQKDYHVLDIGSGIGKFCLAAAYFNPNATFYGVEQREDLVNYAADVSS
ncbi:MAG: methyltransferase domain-containing protein, partial [Flavitalea sp.]